ncbi:hypothetical protein GCM10023091_20080 [Ravibacter arvi]|uniref:DUF2911 domain-containing protein n=1 Tax=Ravibacter arvi TaxID=2051041 RepID=A0ABP8LXR7_9BACT
MKRVGLFFAVFAATLAFVIAQKKEESPRVSAESGNVKIEYGQPSRKGRELFGPEGSPALEKYGKVWRIGANKATEITFKKDGTFGGKSVKAGTYTLFATPSEKDWTIILNGQLDQWGAYKYEQHKGKDVLQVKVPAKTFSNSEEKLTFRVAASSLDFQWGNAGFSVPIKF